MKRYIAVLELDDDEEIVGSISATVSYTYRRNGTNYATSESVEFIKQEPCEDAISRRAVIDIIHHYKNDRDSQLSDLSDGVCNLPPVNTGHWIPVSERLPEMAFGCLVTVEEDDIYGEPQSVLYPEFVGYDGETWNNADGEPIPFEVIAWMPLPEHYEPQESDG